MAGSMATTSNAAMRKKTPFYVSIFMIHDTRLPQTVKMASTNSLASKGRRSSMPSPTPM